MKSEEFIDHKTQNAYSARAHGREMCDCVEEIRSAWWAIRHWATERDVMMLHTNHINSEFVNSLYSSDPRHTTPRDAGWEKKIRSDFIVLIFIMYSSHVSCLLVGAWKDNSALFLTLTFVLPVCFTSRYVWMLCAHTIHHVKKRERKKLLEISPACNLLLVSFTRKKSWKFYKKSCRVNPFWLYIAQDISDIRRCHHFNSTWLIPSRQTLERDNLTNFMSRTVLFGAAAAGARDHVA